MKKTDPRINASIVTHKETVIIAAAIIIYSWLLLRIEDNISFTPENGFFLVGSISALIAVFSVCIALASSYFRYKNSTLPVLNLADAAREVARGNYSVKLEPHRKDGKVDEIDVLYEDFNSMVEELASTEMLKTSFVSNISHELKTPIAVISNYAALMKDKKTSDEERIEYAEKITSASRDLSELITNILQISKLDNDQIEAKNLEFDLSESLVQSILSFDMLMDEKNIDLELDVPEKIKIVSDEGLLEIAFRNILSNAIKFTEYSGKIEISLSQDESNTRISVKDNGCGMDERAVKHIFDKFYQADKSHSAKGNGLGLAMVKKIITLLNGKIEVQSSPGEGSVFNIFLPNSIC
ncbi:MAG: HAMP domain-containing histidine kinase [Lachnospiraceae bacterium]|nr:HAMP domain-containing histidine kinase [Lachnospiraceae bacterium]